MSRPSLPNFPRGVLRDHATDERVERIWSRLSHQLPSHRDAHPKRRPVGLLVAAALAIPAFAIGVATGRSTAPDAGDATVTVSGEAASGSGFDVFATGSLSRVFALPGGGELTLEPGSTVELAELTPGSLTLHLLAGEAALATASSDRQVKLVAGEARLATQPGASIRVRRNSRDVDVSVLVGSVQVESPAGQHELRDGERAEAIPIHAPVARAEPDSSDAVTSVHPTASGESDPADEVDDETAEDDASEEELPAKDWFESYRANRFDEAWVMLEQEPGGVEAALSGAANPERLMAIDHFLRQKNPNDMRASRRVVEQFPDHPLAQAAAHSLYARAVSMGNETEAEKYLALMRGDIVGTEELACRKLAALAHDEPRPPGAIGAAERYLSEYPEGECMDLAQKVLAESVTEDGEVEDDTSSETEAPYADQAP